MNSPVSNDPYPSHIVAIFLSHVISRGCNLFFSPFRLNSFTVQHFSVVCRLQCCESDARRGWIPSAIMVVMARELSNARFKKIFFFWELTTCWKHNGTFETILRFWEKKFKEQPSLFHYPCLREKNTKFKKFLFKCQKSFQILNDPWDVFGILKGLGF